MGWRVAPTPLRSRAPCPQRTSRTSPTSRSIRGATELPDRPTVVDQERPLRQLDEQPTCDDARQERDPRILDRGVLDPAIAMDVEQVVAVVGDHGRTPTCTPQRNGIATLR